MSPLSKVYSVYVYIAYPHAIFFKRWYFCSFECVIVMEFFKSIWVCIVSYSYLFCGVIIFVIVCLKPNFFNLFVLNIFFFISTLCGVSLFFCLITHFFFFWSFSSFVFKDGLSITILLFFWMMLMSVFLYHVKVTISMFIDVYRVIVGVIPLDKYVGSLDDCLFLILQVSISSF